MEGRRSHSRDRDRDRHDRDRRRRRCHRCCPSDHCNVATRRGLRSDDRRSRGCDCSYGCDCCGDADRGRDGHGHGHDCAIVYPPWGAQPYAKDFSPRKNWSGSQLSRVALRETPTARARLLPLILPRPLLSIAIVPACPNFTTGAHAILAHQDILGGWRVGLSNSSPVLNSEDEQGRAPD